MPKLNVPLIALNRGIVSPKALARVDVERTRLSAETCNNWLPKSVGPITLRPGTKYLGASKSNLAAQWVEFVAAADQTALLELTNGVIRVWINDVLMARVSVSTSIATLTSSSGWTDASTAGGTATFNGSGLTLNAVKLGGLAKVTRQITVGGGDVNKEHGLALNVTRGPVIFRVGSTAGGDEYVSETSLATGYHSLAFTPTGDFYLTFQSDLDINKIIATCSVEAAGTVEIIAPWLTANLNDVRYDQSADVVFVACANIHQYRIERRGAGRSWSVVQYNTDDGPFIPGRTSPVRLKVAATYGNTTLTSDLNFFTTDHVGAIFRGFHSGQSGSWVLAREDIYSKAWSVTGVGSTTERRSTIVTTGTFTANLTVQKSFDGEDQGFRDVATITTATTTNVDDADDNLTVWYRIGIKTGGYTSGTATAAVTYAGGGITGICRVTSFSSATVVNVEVLQRFSQTDWTIDWNEGQWSAKQGYPTAVQLYEGRLWWAGGSQVYGSVSDDFANFDDTTEGDSAPIVRSLGKGPVDNISFLLGALRLLVGTASAVLGLRSTGFDEPLTQQNANAKPVETRGAANLRPVLLDTKAMFAHRSGQRLYALSYDANVADYAPDDLSKLVPDLLVAGIVSIAVQRFPDTRIHCVLGNGTVAVLTYDQAEEVLCWSTWSTSGTVEKAAVLPGSSEDAVYYHVNRTINGGTVRYLERLASESECVGGTQCWLMDCAIAAAPGSTTVTAAHLIGSSVILWADGISYSPVSISSYVISQTTFTVGGGGTFTAPATVTSGVVGLPYYADYVTTKLAYGAALGTALNQPKRVDHAAFILYLTHQNGLFFGSDANHLDPLPRTYQDAAVTTNQIYTTFDTPSIPFPGSFDTDSRILLRGYAPHPVTVMAAVPSMDTHEKS